jgi:hypothetical protein
MNDRCFKGAFRIGIHVEYKYLHLSYIQNEIIQGWPGVSPSSYS